MQKVDCESNRWLATALVLLSADTKVFAATTDCEENYKVDDLWISAWTKAGNWIAFPLENKALKGDYQFKYDGQWNPYFSTSNPKGIMKKISGDTIPADYIYFINSSKYIKLINNNCCLAYTAPDGFILFSPQSLKKAYLGNAWYLNKSHTEEFGQGYNPHWELKAIINLEGGTYFPIQGPDIFKK